LKNNTDWPNVRTSALWFLLLYFPAVHSSVKVIFDFQLIWSPTWIPDFFWELAHSYYKNRRQSNLNKIFLFQFYSIVPVLTSSVVIVLYEYWTVFSWLFVTLNVIGIDKGYSNELLLNQKPSIAPSDNTWLLFAFDWPTTSTLLILFLKLKGLVWAQNFVRWGTHWGYVKYEKLSRKFCFG